jgi:3'-5' exonuclease
MGKERFTPRSQKKYYSKPKPTELLVFDIETVPSKDEEYSETQKEFIAKRLAMALKRDPTLDANAEAGKIKGTDPYLSKIVCIVLYYPLSGQRIALTNESEKVILDSFWEQLRGYSGLFISFNGIRFDVPYIIKRSIYHGIKPTNLSFLSYTKYNPNPPHFDVMVQLCGRETPYSLKMVCDFFDIPSPKEGAVSAATVAEAYYGGRIKDIAEYCLRDLESTYKAYEKVRLYSSGN